MESKSDLEGVGRPIYVEIVRYLMVGLQKQGSSLESGTAPRK